jgi:hypothetical protein
VPGADVPGAELGRAAAETDTDCGACDAPGAEPQPAASRATPDSVAATLPLVIAHVILIMTPKTTFLGR